MTMVSSSEYASFLYAKGMRPVALRTVEQAKMCLIDYLACSMIGEQEMRQFNQNYLKLFNDCGKSIIPFLGMKTGILNSAFLSGINSHVAELDDGHRFAAMHLGAPIISAILALSGVYDIDGEDFIRAIVIGYEAAVRLSESMQPSHKKRGFHTTGTCGTVGAAIAVAAALKYSENEYIDTLAAALTDASGLLATNDEGALLKPYNAGRAASAGIKAAFAAKAGMTGRNDFLNTQRGFYHAFADNYKSETLISEYEEDCICTIYRKLYPSCRHSHSPIEAALAVMNQHHIDLNEIEKVRIETYDLAVKGHDHKEVVNAASAKMSIPFCVAAAIADGTVDYLSFESNKLCDTRVLGLAAKTEVIENSDFSALTPAIRAASVTIKTPDGEFTAQVNYPKGEPENPIAKTELDNKFYSLGKASQKDEQYLSSLLDMVWKLEENYAQMIESL